jgi:hypothetical protein
MSEQRLSRDDIFELIKDGSTSYGEARRYASQWAGMPREKQDFHISGHLTLNLAIKTSKLDSAGKYREAAILMTQVPGIGMKSAVKMIKRSRIECRHDREPNVSGTGTDSNPWCKCGWEGKTITGPNHSDKARKKVCPNLKKELAKYGLRYRRR